MDETDDVQDLLDRLQQGDQQALADLFSRYRDRLGRMVEFRLDGRLKGRVAASDVLQEAYIDALKRLPHYQADPGHAVLPLAPLGDHAEARRGASPAPGRADPRRGPGSLDRPSGVARPARPGWPSSSAISPRPARRPSGPKRWPSSEHALDGLDPIDREVLALRHFEELSNREAAAVLGIQPAAASKRYVRALERLKEALSQMTGFDREDP